MKIEKSKEILKAKLECLKREVSGKDIDCNCRRCDECGLCYAQGNIGEQIEALEIAIQILEHPKNDFAEVVDFFNDIMDTLYCTAFPFGESPDSVRFARSIVYKVFSKRYKIKEIERNEKK